MADIRAKSNQVNPVVAGDNVLDYVQMTKQGAIYTGDWIEQAIRAGMGWSVTVGSMTGGTDISRITGGGSGTCMDNDQPEIAIGLGSGLLVPIRILIDAHVDIDAADDDGNILVTVDTAANGMSSAPTGTLETPANMLDGAGGSCSAVVYSAITADITDPTVSEILCAKSLVANGTAVNAQMLHEDYQPLHPPRYAGPCTIYAYWGGVAATSAVARVEFLVLPTSWMPVN